MIRHIKGDCEVEWKPIFKYPTWRVKIEEPSVNKCSINYIEWFKMKNKLYEESDDDGEGEDEKNGDSDKVINTSKRKDIHKKK